MKAAGEWSDTGLVFTSTIGTPLDERNVRRAFDAVLKTANLSWNPAVRIAGFLRKSGEPHFRELEPAGLVAANTKRPSAGCMIQPCRYFCKATLAERAFPRQRAATQAQPTLRHVSPPVDDQRDPERADLARESRETQSLRLSQLRPLCVTSQWRGAGSFPGDLASGSRFPVSRRCGLRRNCELRLRRRSTSGRSVAAAALKVAEQPVLWLSGSSSRRRMTSATSPNG